MLYAFRLFVVGLIMAGSSTFCLAEGLAPDQDQAVVDWLKADRSARADLDALGLPTGLDKQQSEQCHKGLWELYRAHVRDPELGELPMSLQEAIAKAEGGRVSLQGGQLKLGHDLAMPYALIRKEKNEPAEAGRALFICTHGGGGKGDAPGPHAWDINTREWQTQVKFAAGLYEPEGIYFVPRMADDRKGRWFHGFNQDAFERVITHAIAHWGVDSNRVYKLGISQGGFGTNKLVSYMPDRFAGANPMAGGVSPDQHPPVNLRNVAFRNDVGEKDTMFERVGNAIKFHDRLDALHAADPDGYVHTINVQKGRGHAIDYRPGVSWIAQHKRNPWPSKLVWDNRELGGKRRVRHYWIETVGEVPAGRVKITAQADRENNTIRIVATHRPVRPKGEEGDQLPVGGLKGISLRVLLHDDLLDLDQPVRVIVNDTEVHNGPVPRRVAVQLATLADYGDPAMAASAELVFALD